MVRPNARIDDLRKSASLYTFLSRRFLKEPTAEELEDFAKTEQSTALREMGYDFLRGLRRKRPVEQAEALAVEYCRLFVGPGPHLSPHEAVLRGENRHWGEHTVSVHDAYRAAGFEMAEAVREMPGHIGIELAFVATLCEREAELLGRRASGKAAAVRKARERFLAEHPGAWVRDFAREVAKRGELSFYKSLARLAADWVEQELALA